MDMAVRMGMATPHAVAAGIYADISVDGPCIGTLVAVVDRAKNLPNRKTIGKQDPYCAARLGKEAKKTTTDVRGGQTPKWDQELRFTVHDSPDYYQLKVSVFTDDRKTDLIGEAWIDLKDIILPGGGQNDIWQSLSCKGKYAGEIRVEITFYDSRPRPEKPPARHSLPALSSVPDQGSLRQRHPPPVARRPLPSDPITGEPSPPPSSLLSASTGPSTPDQHVQPPLGTRGPSSASPLSPYSDYLPTQSPLQAVEYNRSAPSGLGHHHLDAYAPQPPPRQLPHPGSRLDGPRQLPRPRESIEATVRHHDERAPKPLHHAAGPPRQPSPMPESVELAEPESYLGHGPTPRGPDRPPAPPAHRSRHHSGPDPALGNGYDLAPLQRATPAMPMRHDVLKNEAHRHGTSSYPGRPTGFGGHEPVVPAPATSYSHPEGPGYGVPSPKYYSYDAVYEPSYRPMQAFVEDAPESPPAFPRGDDSYGRGNNSSSRPPHSRDEMMFETSPSPVSLRSNRSQGGSPLPRDVSPGRYSNGTAHRQNGWPGQTYQAPAQRSGQQPHDHKPADLRPSSRQTPPELPLSLYSGVDASLSQEISHQIHEERRLDASYYPPSSSLPPPPASLSTSSQARTRQRSEGPLGGGSPTGTARHARDGRYAVSYSGGPNEEAMRQQRSSPSPGATTHQQHHAIRRKSVSPVPTWQDQGRMSEVPFSPDSYNALNPVAGSSREASPGPDPIESNGKIITHDGREVDPSDHLPMESWAPEPEPKQGQKQTKMPIPEAGAQHLQAASQQPPAASGRRLLRLGRAQPSSAPASPQYSQGEDGRGVAAASVAAGGVGTGARSRLQKKANRDSPGAASPTAMSSPLTPISPDNYQARQGSYTATRGPGGWGGGRGGAVWEPTGEKYTPPPVPGKMPLAMMRGANGGGDQALMEEMQRIEIGSGRSRRKGGY